MVDLPREQERVVAFLLEEWERPFRITTVQQAMDALGMPADPKTRVSIGAYLARHSSLNSRLARWGPTPFILTEDEKLLARYLLGTRPRPEVVPSAAELSQVCEQPQGQIETDLRVLSHLGVLHRQRRGYRVAENFEERAGGLGFTFHKVSLENGERFNVP